MAKIGRNEPCPCGSGQKYKKCCLRTANRMQSQPITQNRQPVSLRAAMDETTREAAAKIEKISTLGVFILFSTTGGDAWALEVTEMDAVQLAKKGKKCEVELEQTPDTIMVNWSHKFAIDDTEFTTTSYKNKRKATYATYPVREINKAVTSIKGKISPELLKELHIEADAT